jgi:hypothetical protein
MKLPFMRTPQHQDEPTVVAMTGARLGDKVHFWGTRPALLIPLAARTGLSGQITIVSPEPEALLTAAERDGLLADANPAPSDNANFDLAVVQTIGAWTTVLAPLLAATRPGGRLVAIAGDPPAGLLGRLRAASDAGPTSEDVAAALTSAGWRRVRPIGERDGLRFVEGVRA